MAKNIAVFLDGTWDTYKEGVSNNSNVGRMYEAAVGGDARQVKNYTPGVGTDWYDRIKGGVAGVGTNDRIQDAYQFITDQYDGGDAIFIFGFSRGAYEARSLCGMVDRVGLLDRTRFAATNRRDMFDIVFNNYTRKKDAPNDQLVANFKATNCVDAPIRMIGVWDTVGALGVPVFATQLTLFAPAFHDLSLGPRVENAYHAMSIDEQRFDFTPTYWDPATVRPGQHLEQVYFAGVHSDVGGGYDDTHGYFVDPTVIETRDPNFRLMREEIFGPVVTTYVYDEKNWTETLDLVDRTAPYGLTGAVFSEDRAALDEAQSALRYAAGNFYVNDKPTGAVVGQQPFGGARASGTNDKAGSMWNLIRWVSPRTIKETFTPPRDYRYPFLG